MTNNIPTSVVVATKNRNTSLSRLLDGLKSQINAPPFEVIIGDNGSSESLSDVIKKAQTHLQIKYVREERPGKSRAINATLHLAQGELIVFTDDDVVPHAEWLTQLNSAAIRYPNANIFGGLIEVNLEKIPFWIKRSHNLMGLLTSAHYHGDSDTIYSYGQYPFGPNMAIRGHLLTDLIAPYPELLGPGTKYPVGDESAFLMQFSPPNAQDRIFVPDARVYHNVEPENVVFTSALRRCFLAGYGQKYLKCPSLPEPSHETPSTFGLILARLHSCKSFPEFVCITARYIGYLIGAKLSSSSI
jgi:glucosyl-dolichyl phosphate glucuronosyltransferase